MQYISVKKYFVQSSYSIEFNLFVESSDTSHGVYDYLHCILRLLSEAGYYEDRSY